MHKPSGMKISPDGERMGGAGMLNFFRVLIQGGYLTELRVDFYRPIWHPIFNQEAGEDRRTQMRMVIGDYGSDPEKHKELYQTFLNDVKLKPQSFSINPEIK